MQRLIYPITEVLELVPISRTTLYGKIKDHSLKVVKIGSRTYVPAEELENFVNSLKEKSEVMS